MFFPIALMVIMEGKRRKICFSGDTFSSKKCSPVAMSTLNEFKHVCSVVINNIFCLKLEHKAAGIERLR